MRIPLRSVAAVRSHCPFHLAPSPEKAAEDLFARFSPAAIVFVEKAGPNEKGVFHWIIGTGRPEDQMANAHLLADLAPKSAC